MKNLIIALTSFSMSFKLFRLDGVLKILTLIPLGLGVSIYSLIGKLLFVDAASKVKEWILNLIGTQVGSGFLQVILTFLFFILFYFIVQWTFLLLLSVLSGPFSEAISHRVEKLLSGDHSKIKGSVKESLRASLRRGVHVFANEFKKMTFILSVSILSFSLNILPFLSVFSLILSGLLVSAQFLDYSWIRYNLKIAEILKEIKMYFLVYTLMGIFFLFLFSIPFINIFIFPYAIIYFSVLRFQLRSHVHERIA